MELYSDYVFRVNIVRDLNLNVKGGRNLTIGRCYQMTRSLRRYITSPKETFQKIRRSLPPDETNSTVKLKQMLRYVCLEFVMLRFDSQPSLATYRFHKHLPELVIEIVLF